MSVICAKIFDDLLISEAPHLVDPIIQRIDERITLGEISHGPGTFRYFGLHILQEADMTIELNVNDNLQSI